MFGDVSLVAVYVAVLLLLTAASTHRMAGAVLGIGGNSKQEAMYPVYRCRGSEARRRQPVHRALRAGPATTCQRVLVADDV
jgi:hypothetical protein